MIIDDAQEHVGKEEKGPGGGGGEGQQQKPVVMARRMPPKLKRDMSLVMLPKFRRADFEGFRELEGIERERRDLLKFASEDGTRILFHWKSTVIYYVLTDAQFWISAIVYIVVRKWEVDKYLVNTTPVPFTSVGVIGGLMSFLLVFFVSQSYIRFNAQYDAAMAVEGLILSVATVARSGLPREDAYRLVRHLNAAQLLAYVGLSDTYDEENFFTPMCSKYQLLTKAELDRVHLIGVDTRGSAAREVVSWCVQDLQQCFDKGVVIIPNYISMMNNVLAFRQKFQVLYEFNDQPVPFAYIHFVYMMTVVYLPLFSYAVANSTNAADRSTPHELIGVFAVLLNNLFVLGLRGLGRKMQDPFGDDVEDLSVLKYVTRSIRTSFRLLKSADVLPVDSVMEEELEKERPCMENKGKTINSLVPDTLGIKA